MKPYVRKEQAVTAAQWQPGVSIPGVTVNPIVVVFSADKRHYYVSMRGAMSWYPVDASKDEELPFAFWKVSAGSRVDASDPEVAPLVRRYLDGLKLDALPPPIAWVETAEGQRVVHPGHWVVRDSADRLSVVPDAEFRASYREVAP